MTEKVPIEGGLKAMAGRETSTETPAAAQAGVPASPGGQKFVTKWKEFVEEEKTLYLIELEDHELEGCLLRLKKVYYPIYPYDNFVMSLYEIEWDGCDTIIVESKVIRNSWYGTGTEFISRVEITFPIPETPMYFDPEELGRIVEEHGVKETMEMIVEDLAESASYAIRGKL